MCIYQDVRKMGKNRAFHIGIQKNRAIHILFVEKRGSIIYLAALKKGAIRHAHSYYAIYRKLLPRGLKQRTLYVKRFYIRCFCVFLNFQVYSQSKEKEGCSRFTKMPVILKNPPP